MPFYLEMSKNITKQRDINVSLLKCHKCRIINVSLLSYIYIYIYIHTFSHAVIRNRHKCP